MERRSPAPIAALLFALTLALYWRTGAFAFLGYDDDVYVTENAGVRAGLTWQGVRWAFTTAHAANWHPLTWLSHQLDVELFGLDAGAHHRTSAVLHALNAALCFLALRALTGAWARSALVAAFFALHPLRVESVAWVAERKDLLAACCAFACLWLYAGYVRTGGWPRYAACLGTFALGLSAKPMLVTLPFVLLLLDVWPLRRLGLSPQDSKLARESRGRASYGVLREKLPFLLLAGASAWVTLLVQRAGGAFGSADSIGLGARVANALHAGGIYVWKTLVPLGLCAYHPHPALAEPPLGPWLPGAWAGLALLVGVSALVIGLRRRAPYALAGWLWFAGMLVPVSGLVQVGLQGWAERYSYLPSVGLWIALVWGASELLTTPRARAAGIGVGLFFLAALAILSHRQIGVWRDSRALFEHALGVDESAVAHVNLGRALEEAGDAAGAERHYERALELVPSLSGVRVNLARIRRAQGRTAEARAELEQALLDDPRSAQAHAELGLLLSALGEDSEASTHLRRAVELDPTSLPLQNVLAWVLATSRSEGRPEEALAIAERLCRVTRNAQAGFLETLAAALARLGRFEEAAAYQEMALANPKVPAAIRGILEERLALYRDRQPFLKSP